MHYAGPSVLIARRAKQNTSSASLSTVFIFIYHKTVMQNGAKLGIADITEYLTTKKLTHLSQRGSEYFQKIQVN